MARKTQKLINFHSSGTTEVPLLNLDYGEIAVRHLSGTIESQLIIKTSENESAVFVESAKVQSMIDTKSQDLQDKIDGVYSALTQHMDDNGTDFSNLSGSVIALSGAVMETYWTSADTKNKLDSISGNVDSLSASVLSFSSTVETYYETIANVAIASGNAVTSAATYAKDYADTVSANIQSHFNLYATSSDTHNAIENLSGIVETFSGNVIEYINKEISIVYKFKGSVETYEDLSSITGQVNGDVWNVKQAHGEPGDSDYTPAGTNYAWVDDSKYESETSGHWDPLGGSVDLANYATTGSVDNLSASVMSLSSIVETQYATKQYVNTVSGNIESHLLGTYATSSATISEIAKASGSAVMSAATYAKDYADAVSANIQSHFNLYATSSDTWSDIARASGSAVTTAKNYTDEVSGNIETHLLGTYATSSATISEIAKASGNAVTEANTHTDTVSGYISTNLNTLSGSVTSLSASVVSIETTANKAINVFELNTINGTDSSTTEQSGAKAKYTQGGAAMLDLSGLIIDCGEW